MIVYHILHFVITALSLASVVIPLFVKDNMRLKRLEADIQALKAFLDHSDGGK